jgi:hypothetical protein
MGRWNFVVSGVTVAMDIWGLDSQIRGDMFMHETLQERRYLWHRKSDVM